MKNNKDKKDKKDKKKGVVVVIALGGKPPKSPTHTADPDEKKKHDIAMQKAVEVLKWRTISLQKGKSVCTNPYCMKQLGPEEQWCKSCDTPNPNFTAVGA
tara:strand:+ start:229 stop:528 length:300 start_codon:yes stop_codon:yes gene_type:complete